MKCSFSATVTRDWLDLAVPNLRRYDYKVTGHRYVELSEIAKNISKIIEKEVGRSVDLLKSLNNPAVQGVVAVSDRVQNERIKRHSSGVAGLRDKPKFWDYEEVLQVHEALQSVNDAINSLGLVPQGF